MIFSYSDLVKNKAKKKKLNYTQLYINGLETLKPMIKKYAETINEGFIDQILNDNDIEIMLYCSNTNFSINNCSGFIIYTKTIDKIYLLLLCVNKQNRKFGYGKVFLEEFIEYIKNKHKKNKKLVLHPLDNTVSFYKTFGFNEINCEPNKYKKLFKYEKYDKNANLLELEI